MKHKKKTIKSQITRRKKTSSPVIMRTLLKLCLKFRPGKTFILLRVNVQSAITPMWPGMRETFIATHSWS